MVRVLTRGGLVLIHERIETAKDMRCALRDKPWDIILSDYLLPTFDAPLALQICKEAGLDIPFIVVSGSIGEDLAVAMMRAGAHDYLLKDNLSRLVPVVLRELGDAQVRAGHRRVEERYRALFQNASDAILICDLEGKILEANGAAASILGYDSASLLNLAYCDITGTHRSLVARRLTEILRLGKGLFETKWRRPDGATVPVETQINMIPYGPTEALLVVGRDITERRRSEEAQALLSATIEQAHDGVVITDPKGAILYTNPAMQRISGYDRENFMGQNPRILRSGLQGELFYKTLWETILSGGLWQGRMTNRRKDGSLYTAEMTVAPVRNREGQITALVATQSDVTQEIALEERLARGKSLETIGLVAGGLAHEIRNPLFAISAVSAALEKKIGQNPEMAPFIEHIQEQVRRLSTLTNDLLTLGRPVSPEKFAPCRLEEILAQVTELSEKAVPGSSERIGVACKGEFVVMGIGDKLVQIFLNLVQNALSIAPAPTPVTVEARKVGSSLAIEVADVGPGIPGDMLDLLFQPFTSRRQGGTGLGLAIVQKIVTAHGGTMEGANRPDGPGAVFTVRLPLA